MELDQKPKLIDNLIGLFILLLFVAGVFVGAFTQQYYIFWIPFIIMGIIIYARGRGWAMGGGVSPGANPGKFLTERKAKQLGIISMIVGLILTLGFLYLQTII